MTMPRIVTSNPAGDPKVTIITEPSGEFERFESLARRLLHVSKDDVREAEAREQEKRRTRA